MPVLVIGLLVYAVHIFLNAALLIHKKTATMTGLVVYACIVNIVMNIILIPRIGLQGAAIATLVSYLFLVVLMGHISFRLLPLKINYIGLACNALAALVAFVVIHPLEFHSSLVNAAVKSGLALLIYAALICLLNPAVREELLKRFRSGAKEGEPARSPLVVTE